jgi:hypothetical protein
VCTAVILLFSVFLKRNLINVTYFSKSYCDTNLQDLMFYVTTATFSSQICIMAIVVLLITEVKRWWSVWQYGFHTNFHENWSVSVCNIDVCSWIRMDKHLQLKISFMHSKR